MGGVRVQEMAPHILDVEEGIVLHLLCSVMIHMLEGLHLFGGFFFTG